MSRPRRRAAAAAAVAGWLFLASAAVYAQSDEVAEVEDEEFVAEEIEEIIVFGERPGDPRGLERIYEDPLRARILRELEQLRVLEEEYEWRREGASVDGDPPRIRWGYDPRDELRTRRETELYDLPMERINQPATIFSVDF